MVKIKFIKGYDKWVPKDIASFDEITAAKLIQEGYAINIDDIEIGKEPENFDFGDRVPKFKEEKLICPICGKKLKTEKSVSLHKKRVHGIKE